MALALASACGGSDFVASRATDEPDVVDAGAELDAVDELADAGDVYIRHDVDELDAAADVTAEPPPCDLKPCQCNNVHMALCCNGPCPSGFEGLTCYCGDCKFGQTYDAGRCF